MVKAYENDTEVKIPDWYLKLPQKLINRISDIGIVLNNVLTRKKKIDRTNKRNIKFHI